MTEPIARLLAWVLGRPAPKPATGMHRSGQLNRPRPAGPSRPKRMRKASAVTWRDFTPPTPEDVARREAAEITARAPLPAVAVESEFEPDHVLVRPFVTRLYEERARKQAEEDAYWVRRGEQMEREAIQRERREAMRRHERVSLQERRDTAEGIGSGRPFTITGRGTAYV